MQTIGERLEEARKRKGVSIREAAEATKIRGEYLHKFESNQYDIRLPEIYVRGFLRSYANFLKLPADQIIADYNALHHGEAKSSRSMSREVYGRMDISTSKDKETKDPLTGGTTPPMPGVSGEPAATTRNPATFVPPHSPGSSLDKKLLIKLGAIIGVIAAIIILIVVLLSNGGSSASAPKETWVQAQAGEATITITAKDLPVEVKVTSKDTQPDGSAITYYQGTIPVGEARAIPRRTDIIIECAHPENLLLTVGNWTGQLTDPATGRLMTRGQINKQ
ncbi:cytoskeleton protein RodZ [Ereboglobus sp. PH5-5]|uniref:helix-turn-helix domain-containing protein n=1 Tax=Ereboglobus sp. PH5-5 TaxID=2940529 RepID=UPI00240576CE|nr:helix-turn-helix domain-containing protein [Ereboglobus sp. PH5-5]MDF9833731.1 cytoskeleton protein RodZ [Ereboglobus sp. PH5-5]